MMVREGRGQVRKTAQKPKSFKSYSWPGPTLGWVANNNLSVSQPGGAHILENWFPTATGAVMRRGKALYSTLGDGDQPVSTIFSYVVGSQQQMFAANGDTIYDVTSSEVLDVVTDQTGGDWVAVQFATAGGIFLRLVNGMDTPLVYDGDSWSTTPALTFDEDDDTTADQLAYVWTFKNRLWLIKKESLDAYYLPVDQIAGELVKFPLSGVFGKGGQLVYGATWSQDVGDGLNAMCAFFSSEGEVAVYQGSDPGAAATWSIVGVYQVGKPMGPNAHLTFGGDLIMATNTAFVPMSEALRREYSVLSANSLSAPIEAEWPNEVANRSGAPWSAALWTAKQMVVVALPTIAEQPPRMLVMNSRTGKWAPFTNWGATCVHVFKDRLFMGGTDGRIFEANVTGLDDGAPFTATYLPVFDQMDVAGNKTISMVRAVLKCAHPVKERMSVHTDYTVRLPTVPDASAVPAGSTWGAAIWGIDKWGGDTERKVLQNWRSQFGAGEVASVGIQITSGALVPLDAEIIRTDALFTLGDVLT